MLKELENTEEVDMKYINSFRIVEGDDNDSALLILSNTFRSLSEDGRKTLSILEYR